MPSFFFGQKAKEGKPRNDRYQDEKHSRRRDERLGLDMKAERSKSREHQYRSRPEDPDESRDHKYREEEDADSMPRRRRTHDDEDDDRHYRRKHNDDEYGYERDHRTAYRADDQLGNYHITADLQDIDVEEPQKDTNADEYMKFSLEAATYSASDEEEEEVTISSALGSWSSGAAEPRFQWWTLFKMCGNFFYIINIIIPSFERL